jgi:hypothetical protein
MFVCPVILNTEIEFSVSIIAENAEEAAKLAIKTWTETIATAQVKGNHTRTKIDCNPEDCYEPE